MDEKVYYRNLRSKLYIIKSKVYNLSNDLRSLDDKLDNLALVNDNKIDDDNFNDIINSTKKVYNDLSYTVIPRISNKC